MTKLLPSLLLASALLLTVVPYHATAQTAPMKQWDKTFGGSTWDQLRSAQQTNDEGYILGGESNSPLSGDKTQASQGDFDYWLVKVDATGTKQWDRSFGGSGWDQLHSVQQTSDGGYILAGFSSSPVGGDKTQANQGAVDYWLVKVDANGIKQWDRSFGGSGWDHLRSVQQTSDGGYILGGESSSPLSGDKTQPNQGLSDYWVVKVDATGTKQWDKTFGGSDQDLLFSVKQTSDGGYILGGESLSPLSGDRTQASQGLGDYWVVKLDATGAKQWDHSFGGNGYDILASVQQTSDGGYILGGESSSLLSGDKTQASQGDFDYWLVKVNVNGSKEWDKTIGGSERDQLRSAQQTSDGGYILGGESSSPLSGDKTQASQGLDDYWVVKVDANGSKQWDKTFGGSSGDALNSLQQTRDGGFMLAGHSTSSLSGDKTQLGQGGYDYWLVKLGAAPLATPSAISAMPLLASPNPTTSSFTLHGPAGTPYHLLNQLGQVVRTGKVSAQPLDVHALPAGLYLLRDATSGRTSKLVKE